MAKKPSKREVLAAETPKDRDELQMKREQHDKEVTEAQKAEEKRVKEVHDAIKAVANTPEGVIMLRAFMNDCMYTAAPLCTLPGTGEIAVHHVVARAAKRELWQAWKALIPVTRLMMIEYGVDVVTEVKAAK